MLRKLPEFPRKNSLANFLRKIFEEKGDKIQSIVLFGSVARGEYTIYSDIDLLVIVSEEHSSFKDRLYEYSKYSDGWVEALVYTTREVDEMFRNFNPIILDALYYGLVIYDKGFWKTLTKDFKNLLNKKVIVPKKNGWIIKSIA